MKQRAEKIEADESTLGILKYLSGSVPSSLFRNGNVRTNRDLEGSDSETKGIELAEIKVAIENARTLSAGLGKTCESNGFELLDAPLDQDAVDFLDLRSIVGQYYPACASLVSERTGGRAYAFDHNIRSVSGRQSQARIAGGQSIQTPIHQVHGDYTLTSAPQRLRDLSKPPTANDTLRPILAPGEALIDPEDVDRALNGGRFAIINVWRSISDAPVVVHPLALCDAQSVHPVDLVVFEIHYRDRIGENYFAKHADAHRWYYYPDMTRDEALLIKQWDSAGSLARSRGAAADASDRSAPCTFSFHSAFEDPDTPPHAPDRWSIEVRCMVIHD